MEYKEHLFHIARSHIFRKKEWKILSELLDIISTSKNSFCIKFDIFKCRLENIKRRHADIYMKVIYNLSSLYSSRTYAFKTCANLKFFNAAEHF